MTTMQSILKLILILVFANLFSGAQAQNSGDFLNQLQGDWTCIDRYSSATGNEDEFYPDGLIHHLCTGDIRITRDQISQFDLPCEFKFTTTLLKRNGGYSYRDLDDSTSLYSISLRDDTLIINEGYHWGSASIYVRASFDEEIINLLLKDSVNQECLYGKWSLVAAYDSGYDGWGSIPYKFPFKVVDTLNFNAKNIKNYHIVGRKLILPTGKEFYIKQLSIKSRDLTLKAAFPHKIIEDNWDEFYFGNSEPKYRKVWEDD